MTVINETTATAARPVPPPDQQDNLLFNVVTGLFETSAGPNRASHAARLRGLYNSMKKKKKLPIVWNKQAHNQAFFKFIETSKDSVEKVNASRRADIDNCMKQMISYEQKIEKITESINNASPEVFEDTILMINKMFPFNGELQAWVLPEYSLFDEKEDVHKFFGMYLKIDFAAYDFLSCLTIKVRSDKSLANFNKSKDFFHPHVNESGRICYGDYEAAARLFWEKKDFFSLCLLVNELLSTYNSSSPYVALKDWIDGRNRYGTCAHCGYEFEDDDDDERHVIEGMYGCTECVVYSNFQEMYIWESKSVFIKEIDSYVNKDQTFELYDEHNVFKILLNKYKEKYFMASCCGRFWETKDLAKKCKFCY